MFKTHVANTIEWFVVSLLWIYEAEFTILFVSISLLYIFLYTCNFVI